MSRAPQHIPSPGAMMRALAQVREMLATLGDDADDPQLVIGTLEGETDAFEVLDDLVAASIRADGLAELARKEAAALRERAARFDRRCDRLRSMALMMMQEMQQTRRETATFTVSIRQNAPELHIDDTKVPDGFCRFTRAPDRALIRQHLKDGGEVPGTSLGNASQGIMVKV